LSVSLVQAYTQSLMQGNLGSHTQGETCMIFRVLTALLCHPGRHYLQPFWPPYRCGGQCSGHTAGVPWRLLAPVASSLRLLLATPHSFTHSVHLAMGTSAITRLLSRLSTVYTKQPPARRARALECQPPSSHLVGCENVSKAMSPALAGRVLPSRVRVCPLGLLHTPPKRDVPLVGRTWVAVLLQSMWLTDLSESLFYVSHTCMARSTLSFLCLTCTFLIFEHMD
jgi:hypothetical protein